jgi:hypothetical protein
MPIVMLEFGLVNKSRNVENFMHSINSIAISIQLALIDRYSAIFTGKPNDLLGFFIPCFLGLAYIEKLVRLSKLHIS